MYFATKYDYRDNETISKAWNRSRTNKYWNKIKYNLVAENEK